MRRLFSQVSSLFRFRSEGFSKEDLSTVGPSKEDFSGENISGEGLSAEAKSQVQAHRLLCLLAASLVPFFGFLYDLTNPAAVDPWWARLGIAGLFVGLVALSYRSRLVRRHFVAWTWGMICVLMVWFALVASLNRFAGDYAIGLLLVYAVLTAVVGLGARTIRPVLQFSGFGLLLTTGGLFLSPPLETSPLLLLASMSVVALVEGIAIQRRLSTRERLRERERHLRGLANSIPGALYQFYARPDGTYGTRFVSERAEEMLGISSDPNTFYEQFMGCVPSSHREELLQSVDEAVETQSPWQFELPFEKPSGERIWLLGTSTPDRQGKELVFNGVILDISERKRAERALLEEKDRFETLFESLPTPVVHGWIGEEGETSVRSINEAFEQVFGIRPQEAEGESVDQLLLPEERQAEGRRLNRKALEEGGLQAEVQRETIVGPRDFQVQVALREEAEPTAGYAIYTDITGRKRREEKLRAAKEEAERMNRMKSSFLANMSHEIRTPLTSIIGFAEMIGEELEEEEESPTRRFARLIEKSGKRLLQTLDAVLNLSKLEAEEMNLRPESIDLAEETRGVAELLEPKAKEAGIDLQTDLPDGPIWARADGGGLRIVLQNLISNAVKYTGEGGQVRVRAWKSEGGATVEVEDTGVGMNPEGVSELFEPFRQESEGVTREYEGSGLGLAVAQKATRRMGGSIEVETEKGEGSRFTVRLSQAEEASGGEEG